MTSTTAKGTGAVTDRDDSRFYGGMKPMFDVAAEIDKRLLDSGKVNIWTRYGVVTEFKADGSVVARLGDEVLFRS